MGSIQASWFENLCFNRGNAFFGLHNDKYIKYSPRKNCVISCLNRIIIICLNLLYIVKLILNLINISDPQYKFHKPLTFPPKSFLIEYHSSIFNSSDLPFDEVASMSMGYLSLASAVGVWRTILWQSAFACQL